MTKRKKCKRKIGSVLYAASVCKKKGGRLPGRKRGTMKNDSRDQERVALRGGGIAVRDLPFLLRVFDAGKKLGRTSTGELLLRVLVVSNRKEKEVGGVRRISKERCHTTTSKRKVRGGTGFCILERRGLSRKWERGRRVPQGSITVAKEARKRLRSEEGGVPNQRKEKEKRGKEVKEPA